MNKWTSEQGSPLSAFCFLLFCFLPSVQAQTPVVLNGTHVAYNSSDHIITQFYYMAGVSPTDIIIPRQIETSPGVFDVITRIGANAFEGSGLDRVAFEAGSQITTIGNYAFQGNPLGGGITLPPLVTSLGSSVFNGCSSLTYIDLSYLSLTTIPNNCFSYCISLQTLDLPNTLTRVGSSAFYYCPSLTYIKIPASVTRIDGISSFWIFPTGCIIDLTEPRYYTPHILYP
jgi:hypothetical protein